MEDLRVEVGDVGSEGAVRRGDDRCGRIKRFRDVYGTTRRCR